MNRREARRDRFRAGLRGNSSVNLISMMDILTVLLLFLLKSYVAGGEVMVPPPGIHLPSSSAQAPPQTSVVIAIDGDEILVGNEHVATIAEAVGQPGLEIAPLATRLGEVRAQEEQIAKASGDGRTPSRLATIQGDRDIEFRVLQKVMFTLNQSGYENVSLAVLGKS